MRLLVAALLLLGLFSAPAQASEAEVEIEALLSAIGDSGCVFVRNGKEHSAEEAEDHLRMKYRRAKRHATTAERFIQRLASKSSFSGKPYQIRCEGEDAVPSGDWLMRRLENFRANRDASAAPAAG